MCAIAYTFSYHVVIIHYFFHISIGIKFIYQLKTKIQKKSHISLLIFYNL